MPILSSEVLSINRCHFSLSLFTCIIFTRIFSLKIYFIFFIAFFISFSHFSHFIPFYHNIHTKWPDLMNLTQLPRKSLHPRNTNRNLGNQVTSTLVNLGIMKNIAMNIMNIVKLLGKHQGRMKTFRVSLELLVE